MHFSNSLSTICAAIILVAIAITGCDFRRDPGEAPGPAKADTQHVGLDTSDATKFFDKEDVPQSGGHLPEESGDVSAREYQGLQEFLPSSVPGFSQAAPPGGSQQEMDGFTLNSAEQQWTTSDGGERLKIIITDCGKKEGGYALGTSLYFPALETGKDTTVKEFKDASGAGEGVTLYSKKSKVSQVTLGLRGRYIIDIKSTGNEQDQTLKLKTIAKQIIINNY